MARTVRVLCVDDDPDFVELTATKLERQVDRFSVETAARASQALDRLADDAFDCVVSDYDMPGMDGLEFLEAVRETRPALPFVLFTGEGSEAVASEAISAGVTDYLQKDATADQAPILANRIENAVEHARASQAVQRSERRLREMIDHVPHLLYVVDADGRYQLVNETLADFHDTTVAEMEGATVGEFIDDRAAERFRADLREVLSTGDPRGVEEVEVPDENGERHVFDAQLVPFDLADTDKRAALGVATEVTERTRRAEELELYETIVEIAGEGAYVLDEDGNYVMVNRRTVERTGYDREELVGSHGSLVLDDEDVETARDAVLSVFRDEDEEYAQFEVTVHARDGTEYPVEIRTVPIVEDGRIQGSVGISRDIDERKERERELERYETIVQIAGDGAYMLDDEGRYTMVNDRLVERTGYEREEIIGKPSGFLIRDEDVERGRQLIRDLLRDDGRDYAEYQTVVETPEGDTYPVEVRLAPIVEDGEFKGTIGTTRNISERKERERRLREQNERLEEFASVVSHDLRNPLNVANGHLELAREDCDSDHLADVDAAHDRMATLIEDLLAMAKEGKTVEGPDRVDLASVARAAWGTVETAEATLAVEADHAIRGDRDRLQQLFENLIRNAIEHGGDDVAITVGEFPEGFYVADDGRAIPADEREAVFESGYSTVADSSGLGLSIVREIVEAHGWEIAVTESEDGGTRFDVTGVGFVEG